MARIRWTRWRFGDHPAARLPAAGSRSDGPICISPHNRNEARRLLSVPPEAVEVIPNCVEGRLGPARERSLGAGPRTKRDGESLARWLQAPRTARRDRSALLLPGVAQGYSPQRFGQENL